MKFRRRAFSSFFVMATLLNAAEADIEFAGVITAEGKTRIALTNKASKTTTWVQPGEQFNGYTVSRYDDREEAVFLKKNGQETRLGLVSAKSADAKSAAPEVANGAQQTNAITTAVRSNLRQLASAARQYQLERGVNSVGYSELVGPDKLIKEIKPVAGENYSTLNFSPNVTAVSVTTSNGLIVAQEISPAPAAPLVTPLPPAAPATQSSAPPAKR